MLFDDVTNYCNIHPLQLCYHKICLAEQFFSELLFRASNLAGDEFLTKAYNVIFFDCITKDWLDPNCRVNLPAVKFAKVIFTSVNQPEVILALLFR